ncbi:hypothetical protein GCM10025734_11190 [Kitasatospora paranensis]|uniref:hypothetical protein n=1 Tax=Kitasatospora paranensis TaxID=258053 RepID=UPI0031E89FBE
MPDALDSGHRKPVAPPAGHEQPATTRGGTRVPPAQRSPLTAGQRAASQLLALREVVLPAAVIAAAVELLADHLDHEGDAVTREATAAVLTRLREAVDPATDIARPRTPHPCRAAVRADDRHPPRRSAIERQSAVNRPGACSSRQRRGGTVDEDTRAGDGTGGKSSGMSHGSSGAGHAVVAGAGIGGLLAARVLSETYGRVSLIDRDALSAAGARAAAYLRAATRTGCSPGASRYCRSSSRVWPSIWPRAGRSSGTRRRTCGGSTTATDCSRVPRSCRVCW